MEADALNPEFLTPAAGILSPVLPQGDRRAIRSSASLPDVLQRPKIAAEVHRDAFSRDLGQRRSHAGQRGQSATPGQDVTTVHLSCLSCCQRQAGLRAPGTARKVMLAGGKA